MNPTDNDNDGLPDAMEYTGMLGSNRKIYYSSPESDDGDGDGLKDSEELGVVYTISRCSDEKHVYIRLDNEIVYESTTGTIEEDSQYYVLMDRFNMVKPGRTLSFCVPYSDAKKIDSDEDGYNDAEDARPLVENEDLIYIFTAPGSCLEHSKHIKERYEQHNLKACLYEFTSLDSFKDAWDRIGLSFFLKDTKPYGDKYYYNAKNVVVFTHGTSTYINMGNDGEILSINNVEYEKDPVNPVTYKYISDLTNKKIESLNLYSCLTGRNYDKYNSVAECFLHTFRGIEQVIAPDTVLHVGNERFFFMRYGNIITVSDEEYTQFEKNDNSKGELICLKCEDYTEYDNPEGFLVFTKDDYNSIIKRNVYEDDVYTGVMYVLPESKGEGYLVFDYKPWNDSYHDPIID